MSAVLSATVGVAIGSALGAEQIKMGSKFNVGDAVILTRKNFTGTIIKINERSIIVATEIAGDEWIPSVLALV